MTTNPFAFWLAPAHELRVAINKIVQNLAQNYDAPVFDPHVTLFVGDYTADDDMSALGEQISGVGTAVSLQLQGICYTDALFKTLFISFADHPALTAMVRHLNANLQQRGDYQLQPHLSLIYKKLSIPTKQKIVRELDINMSTMLFDAIKLVEPGPSHDWAKIDEWRVVKAWQLS